MLRVIVKSVVALSAVQAFDLIVTMQDDVTTSLTSFLPNIRTEIGKKHGERVTGVVKALENRVHRLQEGVLDFLNEEDGNGRRLREHGSSQSLWISNQIYVEAATEKMIQQLKDLPGVLDVELDDEVPFAMPTEDNNTKTTWGVERVGAKQAWAAGFTGEGIVVGILDTGVSITHSILKDSFVGSKGWYDPYSKTKIPNDAQGHGTHVAGTAVGANGYGVAPGAKWMACKGCSASSCRKSKLLACAQFFACPTDPNGKNFDCSKAPHVINNSWGGGQGSTSFKRVVEAWHAMGIIPVFSAGNTAGCGTVTSPSDMPNVISVGAIDINSSLASFSSTGPSKDGLQKPELTAPGVNIVSADWKDDNGFTSLRGTSMAAPHVTGVIALLLQKNGQLTYQQVLDKLTAEASTDVEKTPATETCSANSDTNFPNYSFGAGVVNINQALAAIEAGDSRDTPASPGDGICKWSWFRCHPTKLCKWGFMKAKCVSAV